MCISSGILARLSPAIHSLLISTDFIILLYRKVIKRHDGKLYTILLNYRDSGYQYGIFWYKGEDVPANFTDCYLIFYIDSGMTREMGTIAIRWGKIVSGYVDVETQQIYWYPLLYHIAKWTLKFNK